jgi:DNA-binding transcriptional LysR family regulator
METGFDLAIHGGWLPDSDHKARKLASFREIAVASPVLVGDYPKKGDLDQLQTLPFIAHRALRDPTTWQIKDKAGQIHKRRFYSPIHMDSTQAITETAFTGAGFAILPDYAITPYLKSGELINLLPNHTLREGGIYAVLPSQKFRSIAVDKFLDLLIETFRKV